MLLHKKVSLLLGTPGMNPAVMQHACTVTQVLRSSHSR